jgi:ATP-dependent protease ClpP protease subunit
LRRSAHCRVTVLEGGVCRWINERHAERRIAGLTAGHPSKSGEQVTTDIDGDRWFTASGAVAYDMADEVIGGPAGAPESGIPA